MIFVPSGEDRVSELPVRGGEPEPQRAVLSSGAGSGSGGSVLGDIRGARAVAGRDRSPHHSASTSCHRHGRSPSAAGPDEGQRRLLFLLRSSNRTSTSCFKPFVSPQLLRESIAEHKPHIDKLLKIGPQLAELSLQEGPTVTQRYAGAERRYLAIKEEVKGRAAALDEAVSQSSQVHTNEAEVYLLHE